MSIRDELISRFFRYVAVESQSYAASTRLPSTPGQHELAGLLAEEMRGLGVDDVVVDEHAIVTGVKRGNSPGALRIGFVAHLDTVDVGLSPIIRPQIKRFEGLDLCLNPEKDIWLRVADHQEILGWQNQDIILSDGTSVLGADNKAAIAVIMTLLAKLEPSQAHGDICVAFVPDEEIGLRGAEALDLSRFPCDFAYTIDCCELGEVVVENFNAASGEIVFTGVSAHPMSAKGVLVNPLLMALDFISHFDRNETPERTEKREGYFWFKDLVANDSEARLKVMIRDFDKAKFEQRKERIGEVAGQIGSQYTSGSVQYSVADTYHNIGDYLQGDKRSAELLFTALDRLGIEKKLTPMRGGTDGASLSARGLPTPNFFTGAYNFHSRFEFLPVPAFEKSYQTALMLCALAAEHANGYETAKCEP
ncbi:MULTISPECIES: peptidase T [unclassified Rhizobium]|uniref:peptidase T n=1 Tax=unclassified Rhizobium TaxID=2613769 RepID=UPI001AD9CCA4|nr:MULTISPECIES: peptidase T [unclassified Rhizobium]MBO9101913.1 peptidase T [Rhizobium sp. L58/93]MBO9172084.1 peptidase T [Rhizobium sp. L245/93]QXZ88351.1 peptidase T [Rhizobium sp. K1/93]QXZ94402.1 peptidase T [Rhizobium sp. K15/93]QYA05817.1 peptidase T [Rhizobium sp. B21/90]